MKYWFPYQVGMFTYHEAKYNQDSDFDLVADGIQNVWICKVGSKSLDGSFEEFKNQLLESKVRNKLIRYSLEMTKVIKSISDRCTFFLQWQLFGMLGW